MTTSLESLHKEFGLALNQHAYIGPSKNDPTQLECSKQKRLRMAEVFKTAREQIEEALQGQPCSAKDIVHLKALQQDGRAVYERYTKSVDNLGRKILKAISYYTPQQLKPWLPSCFSNEMEDAEQEAFIEFKEYRNFIKTAILSSENQADDLKKNDNSKDSEGLEEDEEIFDPENDLEEEEKKKTPESKSPKKEVKANQNAKHVGKAISDDDDPALQALLLKSYLESKGEKDSSKKGNEKKDLKGFDFSNTDDIYGEATDPQTTPAISPKSAPPVPPIKDPKKIQKAINDHLEAISRNTSLLDQFAKRPLSLQKLSIVLCDIAIAMNDLFKLDPLNSQSALGKLGIETKTLAVLKDPKLKAALDSDDKQKVLELLENTPWKAFFEEALAQKGQITFGVQKIGPQKLLKLINNEGKKIKESDLINYRGQLAVAITDTKSLGALEELEQFLGKHESCCPCKLVIIINKDQQLSPEFLQILMQLKDRIAEIELQGLEEINFNDLGFLEEEVEEGDISQVVQAAQHLEKFVRHLDSFVMPQLQKVTLSDYVKDTWSAEDFSRLLALCPTMELLKECYQSCEDFQDIVIPSQLRLIDTLDLREYSIDQISHLMTQFSQFTTLDLSHLPITTAHLVNWLTKTDAHSRLTNLKLEGCKELSTDTLLVLAKMPLLARLSLPDLKIGKLPIEKLPKFDNPFKINLFYTTSKATQPHAMKLYTGPKDWAVVFQIPLARLGGISEIFGTGYTQLNPKSVAYWLYQDEYKHLKPQTNISTVLADCNAGLNDDNLVEFMQKFPKARNLSLYHCPNVTNAGIVQLLKSCPNIQTLDLTGCLQINEGLLLNDTSVHKFLKNLRKFIVTGTGITKEVVANFKKFLGSKILFEEAILKISDKDLTDDDALENLLKVRNLTTIKHIDLKGCSKLNNKMLGQLLDHLNAPIFIKIKEKTEDNPQRLNLSILDLTDCPNITDEAFHDQVKVVKKANTGDDQEPLTTKITPKFLGNLDRVVRGGTQITSVLEKVYPQVIFQETEKPLTIQIDPEQQVLDCINYRALAKTAALDTNVAPSALVKYLAAHYLHNRIVVELFAQDSEMAPEVIEHPIDITSEEFCDISLSFKTDSMPNAVVYPAHRDILYGKCLDFRDGFRSGGKFSKEAGLVINNDHATAKAGQAMINVLYDKPSAIENLDWNTAWHVAELIGPKNFKCPPSYYKNLLHRMHSQFDIDNAHDILLATVALEDTAGKAELEDTLILWLESLNEKDKESQNVFLKIAAIAKSNLGLPKLLAKITKIEGLKNDKLIKMNVDEQKAENDRLTREAIKQAMAQDALDDASFLKGLFGIGAKPNPNPKPKLVPKQKPKPKHP